MIDLNQFCEPDETIVGLEDSSVDCDIYMVAKPGRGEHDRVFLDVRAETTPCLLTGGNPFKVETLHGFGRMALLDIATGEHSNIDLEPGVEVEISTGIVYSYANLGEEGSQLIIRDTAKDFDLADEVTAEDMVQALSRVFVL